MRPTIETQYNRQRMQLAIFDLDGTLTRTTRVDEACYVRALCEEFDIPAFDNDWSNYTHSTDPGIAAEVFQKRFGHPPTATDLTHFRQRFIALLAQAFRTEPESCTQIPGAAAALQRLRSQPGWQIALATGSWRASALLKLQAAGLDLDAVPAAFADDSVLREEIVTVARSRARETYGCGEFRRVVSIGDAPWDVRTARRLGLPFLGIGTGRGSERLRREGARAVLPDYLDLEQFLRHLQQVAVPEPSL